MSSDGSSSFPVSSFSTSCLNCSFGISRALCNQGAQSNRCPSRRACFDNSSPFVHPTSFSSFLDCGGRCSFSRNKPKKPFYCNSPLPLRLFVALRRCWSASKKESHSGWLNCQGRRAELHMCRKRDCGVRDQPCRSL